MGKRQFVQSALASLGQINVRSDVPHVTENAISGGLRTLLAVHLPISCNNLAKLFNYSPLAQPPY
eukprot:3341452-Pleurochrysis_carterae.AAC.2